MNTDSAENNKGASLLPQKSRNVLADELRIVIIGKTGTGKSATGNSILGEKTFESKVGGATVTNKCKLGINKTLGRKIVLVDTPGLFDTEMADECVKKELVKCIGMTAPGPHAFLLTVNIGRFTREEQETVKHVVDHFGDGIYNFLTIVFTRADDLENDDMTIESYIEKAPQQLKEMLRLSNNRYVPFNNKLTGVDKEHQVKQLFNRIDDAVNKNGGRCFTNRMYEEAEEILRRREEEMKRKLQEEERLKMEEFESELQRQLEKATQKNHQRAEQVREQLLKIQQQEAQISSLNERNQNQKRQINVLRDTNRRCCEHEIGCFPCLFGAISKKNHVST